MNDSRVDKWRRWAKGHIEEDVIRMHMHRDTYKSVAGIVNSNDDLPPSYFLDYLEDTYATTQAIAVRRQAEPNARVVSLARLLKELAEDAPRITREFFVEMMRTDDPRPIPQQISQAGAHDAFTEHYAGAVGDHIDPNIPTDDLSALTSTAAGISAYVDEYVAHRDARAKGQIPTYDDLDAAIDQIGSLYRKYCSLLTASAMVTLVPVHQDDWLAIFRRAWIPAAPDA